MVAPGPRHDQIAREFYIAIEANLEVQKSQVWQSLVLNFDTYVSVLLVATWKT